MSKKQTKIKRVCIDCHYLVIINLAWNFDVDPPKTYCTGEHFQTSLSVREQIKRKEAITLPDNPAIEMETDGSDFDIGCHWGCWGRLRTRNYEERYTTAVEKDRSGRCDDLFFENDPDMTLECAEKIQERKLLQSNLDKEQMNRMESLGTLQPSDYEFIVNGEYWKITYEGKTINLKGSIGLQYIHYLLGNPEKEFYALELVHVIKRNLLSDDENVYKKMDKEQRDGQLTEDGITKKNTIEHLDKEAIAQYEESYNDLKKELNDKEMLPSDERAEEITNQIDRIKKELTAGCDKRGKPRKLSGTTEKARKAISKAVNNSLDKVQKTHPVLWKHFQNTLIIGISSSYKPEKPIHWNL